MSHNSISNCGKICGDALLHQGVGRGGLRGGGGEGGEGGGDPRPDCVHSQKIRPVARVDDGESLQGGGDDDLGGLALLEGGKARAR